jgi:hypothetical protein
MLVLYLSGDLSGNCYHTPLSARKKVIRGPGWHRPQAAPSALARRPIAPFDRPPTQGVPPGPPLLTVAERSVRPGAALASNAGSTLPTGSTASTDPDRQDR